MGIMLIKDNKVYYNELDYIEKKIQKLIKKKGNLNQKGNKGNDLVIIEEILEKKKG